MKKLVFINIICFAYSFALTAVEIIRHDDNGDSETELVEPVLGVHKHVFSPTELYLGVGDLEDLSFYRERIPSSVTKMLFLGDGETKYFMNMPTMAEEVAKVVPSSVTEVVRGDIEIDLEKEILRQEKPNIGKIEKLHTLKLDNLKLLESLRPNSFDFIVMKNGLCVCGLLKKNRCCGGFESGNKSQMKHFFESVIILLNKDHKNSRAYLHGKIANDLIVSRSLLCKLISRQQRTIDLWKQILEELEAKYRINVEMHLNSLGDLNYLVIIPR